MATTSFKQIKRTTITERASEQIKEMIFSGYYKPGDKLPSQKELEQMMNISRPTLREAISRLISANVLEARQGQGYFVKKPQINLSLSGSLTTCDMNQLKDLFEARLCFEASLTQLTAVNATDAEIDELKNFIIRLERKELKKEETVYGGNYVHLLIAKYSHNVLLSDFEETLLKIASKQPGYYLGEQDEELRYKYEIEPHRRIVDAIAARNPAAAYAESIRHIINYTNDIGMKQRYSALLHVDEEGD